MVSTELFRYYGKDFADETRWMSWKEKGKFQTYEGAGRAS